MTKHVRFVLLFFIVLCCSGVSASYAAPQEPDLHVMSDQVKSAQDKKTINPVEQKKERPKAIDDKIVIGKSARYALAVSLLAVAFLFDKIDTISSKGVENSNFTHQFTFQEIVKTFCFQYFSHYGASACHELGHALAAKFCNGDPIDIHLGANSGKNAHSLVKFGGVSVDGFSPYSGYAVYSEPCENKDQAVRFIYGLAITSYCKRKNMAIAQFTVSDFAQKEFKDLCSEIAKTDEVHDYLQVNKGKQAAIILAGGLSGILGNFLFKFLASTLWHIKDGEKAFLDILSFAMRDAAQFDNVVASQLSNLLMPFGSAGNKSDAFKLYNKCFGIDAQTFAYAEHPTQFVNILMEYYLVNAQQQGSKSLRVPKELKKCSLAVANYLLRGYFYAHA